MEKFLSQQIEGDIFELVIDSNIFAKEIVLKSAYNFLDKGYFFFRLDTDKNIILQFRKKEGVTQDSEKIIGDFSDELLSVYLRDRLEHDNKDIREKIVGAAIGNSIDNTGYVQIDTNQQDNTAQNQIDFDKDIDEILKEIENDPELKVDEAEIEKILKEIEEETEQMEPDTQKITLDANAVKNAKEKFQNR